MAKDKELEKEENEFTQDAEEVQALVEEDSPLVPYIPKSKAPFQLKTLIPRNMAFEVQKSLNRVVKMKGNIDNYVRDALKYPKVNSLWKALAAEQVDSIGLYLLQFEKEEGIIIADQTGVGKGRQAASVIRHAIMNGCLPVFFTRKADLFTDIYRDLKNIDFADIKPFFINTGNDAKIKDADGHIIYTPISADQQETLLVTKKKVPTESPESITWHRKMGINLPDIEKYPTVELRDTIDHLPSKYDCIFTTYSQIQSAAPYKREWLENLISNSVEGSKKYKQVVFILDESHMAGGYESEIGVWMRNVLPKTKACCFLSATFAKYPEVMPFYAKKTAIQESSLGDGNFVGAMIRGGLALQEIIASNLSDSGQLIRRQRSSEGILVEYTVLDQEPQRTLHRESVNQVIKIMNEIVAFEKEYIAPLLAEIHEEARGKGENMETKPRNLGVNNSPYFSRVFSIVDQMLFALKVTDVAQKTIDLLNQNKKVVIAFRSTLGAYLQDLNLVSGDVVLPEQLDFTQTLLKGLDSIFYYNYTNVDGEKSRMKIREEALPITGVEKLQKIKQQIEDERTGLTISPIDQLIHILENTAKRKGLGGHHESHFTVGEVTGRNQRVRFNESGKGTIETFSTDAEKFFRQFNHGDIDVLLVNAVGSTGLSAHASEDFKDQRVRAMISHQFELDINTEIQKRGRIDRTGQVVLPEFYNISSDIAVEKRFFNMAKSKLKSLDANTTGSQKTNENTLKSPDFFNKYGDRAAHEWARTADRQILEKLGHPTYTKTENNGYTQKGGIKSAMKQITGRCGLLLADEQDQVYDELLERYNYIVSSEKQQGTYDLELEFLRLDADVKKRFLFKQGTGGATPFGKDSVRDETIINNMYRPFTKDEVDERITKALNGDKPLQVQQKLLQEFNENFPTTKAHFLDSIKQKIKAIQEEIEKILTKKGQDSQQDKKIERDVARLKHHQREYQFEVDHYTKWFDDAEEKIKEGIKKFKIGDVVKLPIPGSPSNAWGIFLEAKFRKSNYTYIPGNTMFVFLVADSRRALEYDLLDSSINKIEVDSKKITEEEKLQVQNGWDDMIKEISLDRVKRQIITENIVRASDTIGRINKLIKYNTQDGTVKNGILMHHSFGKEEWQRKALIPISEALIHLKNLPLNSPFSDLQDRIHITKKSARLFEISIEKTGNKELYTDQELRSLLTRAEGQDNDELPDFVQEKGRMNGMIQSSKLERFLKHLDSLGITYLGEERELEDWEIENEKNWAKRKQKRGSFHYRMNREYGQGSNPVAGFTNYEEPSPDYPYGVVKYNRPLTDKERYNYSLIPIFKNAEQPYQAWKKYMKKDKEIKQEFNATLEKVKDKPFQEAMLELGYFITNNPHENGNKEFVFGDFLEDDLGKVAYEDAFGAISPIKLLIEQLKIELEAA